jgi:hypothetical protein
MVHLLYKYYCKTILYGGHSIRIADSGHSIFVIVSVARRVFQPLISQFSDGFVVEPIAIWLSRWREQLEVAPALMLNQPVKPQVETIENRSEGIRLVRNMKKKKLLGRKEATGLEVTAATTEFGREGNK